MPTISTNKVDELNVALHRGTRQPGDKPLIVFLTGASGAGKTHLATYLQSVLDEKTVAVDYFDRIEVPSSEEMIRQFGSTERWQEAKTHEWVNLLSSKTDKAVTILEGQYNPDFAVAACRALGVSNFVLAVIDASDAIREQRLAGPRAQPELINSDMRNWARVLKEKTIALGGAVINTSEGNLNCNASEVAELILKAICPSA